MTGSAPRSPPPAPPGRAKEARYALVILTAMNLLNYLDRFVPSAVKDLFKRDLHLTDAQTSYPLTAFVVVYMIASPLFGSLSEKAPRKHLIAAGVALWSLATASAAMATGFFSFLLARAAVGVGEAAYATLSPPLISDFYPPARRNRALTFFYVAIPVGAALGYLLGGEVGTRLGWRWAFLIAGLPGLLAAGLVLFVREPPRGALDIGDAGVPLHWPEALRALARNREFVLAVLGYTAVTFASGALADWYPTYLHRHRGLDLAAANRMVGSSAVIGGLLGTLSGGFLADRLGRWTRKPYLALCAVATLLASGFAVLTLRMESPVAIAATLYAAQFFLWFYNGPINTVLVNSVSSRLRVRAFSVSILSIHLFGDAISPSVVGKLSDLRGLPAALSLVPVAMAAGALIWGFAWRSLPDVRIAELETLSF